MRLHHFFFATWRWRQIGCVKRVWSGSHKIHHLSQPLKNQRLASKASNDTGFSKVRLILPIYFLFSFIPSTLLPIPNSKIQDFLPILRLSFWSKFFRFYVYHSTIYLLYFSRIFLFFVQNIDSWIHQLYLAHRRLYTER